jgi:hypothetical protein
MYLENSSRITSNTDELDKIRKCKQLYDDGIITLDEFESMKKKILDT